MKKVLSLLLGILCHFSLLAQNNDTTYWKVNLKTGVNLNQASFSSNWNGGGVNSLGFLSYLNFKADYLKGKHSWDNQVDLAYGIVSNADQRFKRKSQDLIYIDTKYGYSIAEHWDVFMAINFQSQFADGYEFFTDSLNIEQRTLISDFFAPAFLTFSWGVEYKPVDYFKVRFSPFAPRFTFRSNTDVDRDYGVDPGKTVRTEWAAAQILAEFNKDLAKDLNLTWRYILFANYNNFDFKTIDHRLDLALTAKITNYVNVALTGIVLYDRDQDDQVQLSQALTLGLIYTFKNFEEEE